MADLEIQVDAAVLTLLLTEAGPAIRAELLALATKAAHVAGGAMKREIVIRLDKDPTGAMARSVRPELVSKGETDLVVHVGPHTIYAELQNDGGTVHPKNKYLAIPLSFANVRKGKWPRDWGTGELFFMKRGGGKSPLLVEKSTGKPKYVLKTSVKIPGVGYVEAAADASKEDVEGVIADGIAALLERVKGGA